MRNTRFVCALTLCDIIVITIIYKYEYDIKYKRYTPSSCSHATMTILYLLWPFVFEYNIPTRSTVRYLSAIRNIFTFSLFFFSSPGASMQQSGGVGTNKPVNNTRPSFYGSAGGTLTCDPKYYTRWPCWKLVRPTAVSLTSTKCSRPAPKWYYYLNCKYSV